MTNPLLQIVETAATPVLSALEGFFTNVAANPTVENTIAQAEALGYKAIAPSTLEGVSIGDLATEGATLIADLQAKIAPVVVTPVAESAPTA